MSENESAELMAKWKAGDQEAATDLFHRYADRLIALARTRLSDRIARRVDPEDVVQSAYRSFFSGARAGRYDLRESGDLWRLLVGITIHKLQHQVDRHTADKRDVRREQNMDLSGSLPPGIRPEALAGEPSPSQAVALADELEHLMRDLEPRSRKMLELRLQGYTLDEIADQTQRSQRTVRRLMDELKARLEQQYRKSLAS